MLTCERDTYRAVSKLYTLSPLIMQRSWTIHVPRRLVEPYIGGQGNGILRKQDRFQFRYCHSGQLYEGLNHAEPFLGNISSFHVTRNYRVPVSSYTITHANHLLAYWSMIKYANCHLIDRCPRITLIVRWNTSVHKEGRKVDIME